MSILDFVPAILFVLGCTCAFQLSARIWKPARWAKLSLGRWLFVWSSVGFAAPLVLLAFSWITGLSIGEWTAWVWPFSIGVTELGPDPVVSLLVVIASIATMANAVFYSAIAAGVWGASEVIPKLWHGHQKTPSILGR